MVFKRIFRNSGLLPFFALIAVAQTCIADEGLWLYNQFPHKLLEQQHGLNLNPATLEHLRLSTVNLSSNFGVGPFTAAAFVSRNGLIAANHFVVKQCIVQVQRPGENLLQHAFYAQELQHERICPGLEASVLISIEDVTRRVRTVAEKHKGIAYKEAMSQASAAEERACSTSSVKCTVVPLYAGALLHLYRYQIYRDVRLVFAPEESVAFYGGEDDNFNFPRWSMTVCFLRVWNGQQPAQSKHYFRWSATGPRRNELVFQSANARTTDRARPVSFLEVDRDVSFPTMNLLYRELIKALSVLKDPADEALEVQLSYLRNSLKAQTGRIAALQNTDLIEQKKLEEKRMDQALLARRSSAGTGHLSRSEVENAAKEYRSIAREYWLLEVPAVRGRLFGAARWIVRWKEESRKPSPERLPEFEAGRVSSQQKRFLDVPKIDKALEIAILGAHLRTLYQVFGLSHPIGKQLFSSKSPEEVAAAAINESALANYEVRKAWLEKPASPGVESDPLTRIAAILDVYARRARITVEQSDSVQGRYTTAFAQSQLHASNKLIYPEATDTLRVTWGRASGFGNVPYTTRIGQWLRNERTDSRKLPDSFERARDILDPDTTVNFVSTVDVANGHAGPTVDQHGDLVGMLFDSNYAHIGNAYLYLETGSRAVHMSTAGALETLRKVYRTSRIVDELDIVTPAAQNRKVSFR